MSDNRRSTTRYTVQLSGILTCNGEGVPVQLHNLSLGGAFITGVDRLSIGTQVAFSFSIPTHESEIEVQGVVRWSTELGVGIQFDGLRAREVWSLNKYFENIAPSAEEVITDVELEEL